MPPYNFISLAGEALFLRTFTLENENNSVPYAQQKREMYYLPT